MTAPYVKQTIIDGGLGIQSVPQDGLHVVMGVCSVGTPNTLYQIGNPANIVSTLGQGPGSDCLAYEMDHAGGPGYFMPINPSVAGTVGSVTHTGTGTGTLATTGSTPFDSYNVVVTITRGGVLGTAAFTYSVDDIGTQSAQIAVPSGGSYTDPNTGLILVFGITGLQTFVVGDTYAFTTTEPGYTTTDLNNALTAILAIRTVPYLWLNVVGIASSAANSAAVAAVLATALDGAETNLSRPLFAIMSAANDTDSNLEAAFVSFVDKHVYVAAGFADLVDPLTGFQYKRPASWVVSMLAASVSIQTDLAEVDLGPLPGVTKIYRDESATPGLDSARFTTLRTFPQLTGFYITNAVSMAAPGSDYTLMQYFRVVQKGYNVTYPALLRKLSKNYRVNESTVSPPLVPGAIDERDARSIESDVNSVLGAAVVTTKAATSSSVTIDRTINLLSTQTIEAAMAITPLGYAKAIISTISLRNPAASA